MRHRREVVRPSLPRTRDRHFHGSWPLPNGQTLTLNFNESVMFTGAPPEYLDFAFERFYEWVLEGRP